MKEQAHATITIIDPSLSSALPTNTHSTAVATRSAQAISLEL